MLGGPRLFARDLERGELVAVRTNLHPGQQRIEMSLLEGQYEFDAVPLGQVHVAMPEGTLVVGAGAPARASLTVSANDARTMTMLRGVESDEFPLRVTLRTTDGCVAVGQDLLAIGPTAWHLPAQNLPSVPRPHDVVVFTRRRALVSQAPITLQGASIEVPLVPATAVRVHWVGTSANPTLTVASQHASLVVPLRSDVVREGTTDAIAWVAQVVVPHGHAVFDCSDAAGRQLWSRSLHLDARTVQLP